MRDFFSADGEALKPGAIRAFASLMNDPKIISFAGGAPNPMTFPAERIAELAQEVITSRRAVSLQYGPTRGLLRLRELVSEITNARGIRSTAADVMITTGSQQALDLIAHAVIDPGDIVLVELPTYVGGTASFVGRRAELIGVEQDEDGLRVEHLRQRLEELSRAGRRVKMLYTIPNFQNPSGRLLAAGRRREIVALAEQYRFVVIEDDPYGELTFDAEAVTTPMKSHDESGVVVYLSSFSKVLAPGLRCGWIVAPEPLLRKFELAKEAADLCSGMLDQSIVEAFCAAGELPAQVARVRAFYTDRRNVLMSALTEHFGGRASWTNARGGLFTFVTLHDDRDTKELVPRAIEKGVAFIPGGAFFVDGSHQNSMRLTFAKEPDDRMREGVARLASVFFA